MAEAKGKKTCDDEKQFIKDYDAVKLPKQKKPINTSKFTLMQQLKRFRGFSHNEEESEVVRNEVQSL